MHKKGEGVHVNFNKATDWFKKAADLGVQFTGFIDNEDLPAFFRQATMLVYPSLYEGFGLPLLEAMACETPVIASQTSSIPEVAGEAAL